MARPPQRIRLGDLLIQRGLLTDEQLKQALDEQKRSGRKLGRISSTAAMSPRKASPRRWPASCRREFVDLRSFQPKPELIKLLPEAQARRFRAIVLGEQAGLLRVGMADPTDLTAYDEVARIVRRDIELAVVTESQLLPRSTASTAAPRKSPAWPRN